MRRQARRTACAVALLLLPAAALAQPEPVRLVAAGSLTAALGELARAFPATPGGVPVNTRSGPSGLMREGVAGRPGDFGAARLRRGGGGQRLTGCRRLPRAGPRGARQAAAPTRCETFFVTV